MAGFREEPSQGCQDKIKEISCLFCDPDQTEYYVPHHDSSVSSSWYADDFYVCSSFCDAFYTACLDAYIANSAADVHTAYHSGTEFCTLFPPMFEVFHAIVEDPHEFSSCYDPEERPCTEDDYVCEYTVCENNHRAAHWSLANNGDDICAGGVPAPESVFGLVCDQPCDQGLYLPCGSHVCKECDVGTFSVGGGVRFDEWPSNGPWPTTEHNQITFSTYCVSSVTGEVTTECDTWHKADSYIYSGNNIDYHNIESVLEVDFTLVRDGHVKFQVKVDAEMGFDGLTFELSPNQQEDLGYGVDSWAEYSYPVKAGAHTIRFIYHKDFITSVGDDMARINLLEIEGTKYADSECTPCAPGTFASVVGSSECKTCPTSYVPDESQTTCEPCTSDAYSLPGDSTCTTRAACVEEDSESHYTECGPWGANGAPVRNKTYVWKTPTICNPSLPESYVLEPSETIPCKCEAGEYLTPSLKCSYCPEGQASPFDGDCTTCGDGTEAKKAKIYDHFFQVMPDNWQTGCYGCASRGFRRHADYLDAGFGEGIWDSWLTINETFDSTGEFLVQYVWDCPLAECTFSLWLGGSLKASAFSSGSPDEQELKFQINTPGNYLIHMDFGIWNGDSSHNHNIRVDYIQITGTTEGGAPACTPCEEGHISHQGHACVPCEAGSQPSESGSYCEPCPVDTFSDAEGLECMSCGHGTSTTGQTGQTSCDLNGCQYSGYLHEYGDVSFDLSPLDKPEGMWGPILDSESRHIYWLNLCEADHSNGTCVNEDGSPMETYACQITGSGKSINLGRVFSYVFDEYQSLDAEQIQIKLTEGSTCYLDTRKDTIYLPTERTRAEKKKWGLSVLENKEMLAMSTEVERGTTEVQRQTTITIICDPSAGLGVPQGAVKGVEPEFCKYEFIWYSIYGCHACTPNDYHYSYSDCKSGTRTKTYSWNFLPRRCVGDLTLPPEETEGCSVSQVVCPPGQNLSPQHPDTCAYCPAGTYSIGGGVRVDYWPHTIQGFELTCEDANGQAKANCSAGWVPKFRDITVSGHMKDTAVLATERNFARDGTVTFTYSLMTENDEPFEFWIDGKMQHQWVETSFGLQEYTQDVTVGTHRFEWKFSPFIKQQRLRYASIHAVEFNGTSWASVVCDPCPPGTVSDEGSSKCSLCPSHTFQADPTHCEGCHLEGEFSLMGDELCRGPYSCTVDDFYPFLNDCEGGNHYVTYVQVEPYTCLDDENKKPESAVVPCTCPLGTALTEDETCAPCTTPNQYMKDGVCTSVSPGHSVINVEELFTHSVWIFQEDNFNLPDGVSLHTSCTGDCGTPGWRYLGYSMDSGKHFDNADSMVTLEVELAQHGKISFEYSTSYAEPDRDVAMEFFVNGEPQHLPVTIDEVEISFPLPAGFNTLVWLHHQDTQTLTGAYRSVVSNIKIFGTVSGGTTDYLCPAGFYGSGNGPCKKCPAGSFSAEGASSCVLCPVGTFASSEGSTVCLPCGAGTTPNKGSESGSTGCTTDCTFYANLTNPLTTKYDNFTYDLNFLRSDKFYISVPEWEKEFSFMLCDQMKHSDTGCDEDSYVCENDLLRHESFNAGEILNFHPNGEDPTRGYTLKFSHGSSDTCPFERSTIVHVACSILQTDRYLLSAQPGHVDEAKTNCTYHMTLSSRIGCVLCTEDMLTKNEGECIEGKRTISYSSEIICLGIPPSTEEDCTDIEVNEFAVLIVAGLIIIAAVGLLLLTFYFWTQKRQVSQKYELLVAEGKGSMVEMEELGTAETTGDYSE
eukprot:CAMPEP_0174255698 /NCGR_PEP_ID=MMETSP0439-20130205/5016_1 /TAXON_ID=0 /ORGANISM="Stereomyxa ramosa, Strain Chinc5" /LENGTH=1755 /DNA_ID=CAMNT_0015337995 /DNA_START=247 /DNA_END=5511 /DNA_ORIENTATION=+